MIKCTIPIRIDKTEMDTLLSSIGRFSEEVSACGVSIDVSSDAPSNGMDTIPSVITINVDDKKIMAMKGAKRGPKEKKTRISVEEMRSLKDAGVPSKEIAAIAGIGVATYFRRMAEQSHSSPNEMKGGEK